ncbi:MULTISPECIES: hypothetical protein [unclassified Mesorhizobium]|uniref:hypothetical protein n=1 Tax=unclassified Mesorhizobium TaxID=325217 RepID=UPI001ABFDAD3|nr:MULTISPECIES: hypothetical protein [unclassified Mesorhizobium]
MLLILQHFFLISIRWSQSRLRHFTPKYDPFRHVSICQGTRSAHEKWPPTQNSRPAPGVSGSVCAETTHGAGQTETERQVDRGETPTKSRIARLKTFGDLIDLHIDDMCDVGKSPRRSKAAALDMLQRHLGKCSIASLDRERLIRFGRDRATQGGCPMTLGIDVGFVKLILAHAAAVHGLPVRVEPIDLARIALKRLGLVGKGNERDRRPTQDELDRLANPEVRKASRNPSQTHALSTYLFSVLTASASGQHWPKLPQRRMAVMYAVVSFSLRFYAKGRSLPQVEILGLLLQTN